GIFRRKHRREVQPGICVYATGICRNGADRERSWLSVRLLPLAGIESTIRRATARLLRFRPGATRNRKRHENGDGPANETAAPRRSARIAAARSTPRGPAGSPCEERRYNGPDSRSPRRRLPDRPEYRPLRP